ncbi:MAG: DUF4340 domain-containing protein [Lachnospiraceae bacterium]
MNRFKKLLSLFGILVIICVATVAVMKYEVHKENIKNSDTIIIALDTDSVTALSWKNSTTELSFHKTENWSYDGDEAFPADEEKINEMLQMFKEFGASFIIEEVEDYGQYGLDDPVCTIQITTAAQTADTDTEESDTLEIRLGDFSKMDSKRYVSIGDGNVYLVEKDPLEQFDAELSDMIRHDEVPDLTLTNGITFAGDIAYHISYDENGKSYQDEDVYFVNDGNDSLPLDTSLVDSYLREISGMRLTDYVTYNVSDEELASYGLDSPDLSITVDYTFEDDAGETEDIFVLHISRDPAAEEVSAGEDTTQEDETITAYARVGDSRIIYKLDGDDYKMLMKAAYNDLRHQSVYYGNFDDVTGITISLEGGEYTITSEMNEEERVYYYGEEQIEPADIRKALKALYVEEFTEAAADGKEEIRLTLYMENEDFPQIEIVLYRHDGERCLAEVNGSVVAYISRADAVTLIEAVHSIIL